MLTQCSRNILDTEHCVRRILDTRRYESRHYSVLGDWLSLHEDFYCTVTRQECEIISGFFSYVKLTTVQT